jgi:hypothetical protein
MDRQAFLARVGEYHRNGWRLALINATTIVPPATDVTTPATEVTTPAPEALGAFEVTWAFSKDDEAKLESLREVVTAGDKVPSVSEFFGAAFLYENEIRELFGIDIEGIGLDLQGQLYKTATKIPFSHAAIKARLAAVAAASAAATILGKKA